MKLGRAVKLFMCRSNCTQLNAWRIKVAPMQLYPLTYNLHKKTKNIPDCI